MFQCLQIRRSFSIQSDCACVYFEVLRLLLKQRIACLFVVGLACPRLLSFGTLALQ